MAERTVLFVDDWDLPEMGIWPENFDEVWSGVDHNGSVTFPVDSYDGRLSPLTPVGRTPTLRMFWEGAREDLEDARDKLQRVFTGKVELRTVDSERVLRAVAGRVRAVARSQTSKDWDVGDHFFEVGLIVPRPTKEDRFGKTLLLDSTPRLVPMGTAGALVKSWIYGVATTPHLIARRWGGEVIDELVLATLGTDEAYLVDHQLQRIYSLDLSAAGNPLEDANDARTSGWPPRIPYEDGVTLELTAGVGLAHATELHR